MPRNKPKPVKHPQNKMENMTHPPPPAHVSEQFQRAQLALLVRMTPLTQQNRCEHPWLQILVRFKGEHETAFPCPACRSVVMHTKVANHNFPL